MEKLNIVVTGGKGFIGKHLCAKLRSLGHGVFSFDIANVYSGSVLYASDVKMAFAGESVVIHLAASLGVANTENNRKDCLDTNIIGTKNVVDACEGASIKHLIYISSSEVYGDADEIPTPEISSLKPKSIYAITKIAGEEYVKASSTPWTIVRPFNIYGPGQRDDFVIPTFIKQALAGEAITVRHPGTQSRAFCYISDFVDAITLLVEAKGPSFRPTSKLVYGQVFNVGDSSGKRDIVDLARLIGDECGKSNSHSLVHGIGDREIKDRCPDAGWINFVTGWYPRTSLRDGLRKTIEWYKSNANTPKPKAETTYA